MNEAPAPSTRKNRLWLKIAVNLVVCLAILGGAIAAIIWINQTEPVAEKLDSTRKSAALVDTVTVHRDTFSPRLEVLGTVQAAQRISLRPRVQGQVIGLSPRFVPGGKIKQGEMLLRIDPADFENALSISESELAQANASLEIEKARQQLAEKELKLLEGSIGQTNRGLVMREPQLASIEAEVAAAQAAVDRAKLDLERTEIVAPFDAQILTRTVNIGSQVGPGDELGQLIGQEEYWIMATVPIRSLRWIQFPEPEASPPLPGSEVKLRNPDAWGSDTVRQAKVVRLIGALDQQTRLARVLISVADPLSQRSEAPPLILDTLLDTEIVGRPIADVVRLEREFVRDQDTVWVMEEDKLVIRTVDIVFEDAQYAYIRNGLEDGDEVVITTLATVAPGVGLRKISPKDVESPSTADSGGEGQ